MKLGGGGDSSQLAYTLILVSVLIMTGLSLVLPVFLSSYTESDNLTVQELEKQYYDFTGSSPTSECVWGLKGVFTAYGYDYDGNPSTNWGYTEDGWLFGQRVVNYTPSQYNDNKYSARYDEGTGLYYYTHDSTTQNQHKAGDLYGSVVMDVNQKSTIFFTNSGKVEDGNFYYYKFNGLRYSFSPILSYKTVDNNGNYIDVAPEQSSLSLIWYSWYGNSGISGQLIISSGDGDRKDNGVAYLTASEIVSAFNTDTSTSRFTMNFNGVDMFLSLRLDPAMLSSGLTVEQCFNAGYWSVMVSSKSADVSSMANGGYAFDPTTAFQTMLDLLTFKTADYHLTGMAGLLASFIVVIPLAVGLIIIGMNHYEVIILAGIWAVISAWNWGVVG